MPKFVANWPFSAGIHYPAIPQPRSISARTAVSQRDNPTIARRFNAGVLAHGHQSQLDG
jgi:hypothetical protein